MPLENGTILQGRYQITETLGKGGMGAVYKALDTSLGVTVAVKENLVEDEEALTQFRREATILANLRHPNLPRVTDHFQIDGQGQYLVMDFIEGEDLRDRMERLGKLEEKEVLLIGVAICEALSYLHTLNPPVLHRDIKPGNIKITPQGQVFLVDFGLAKVVHGSQETATGARGLTPGYSPPEQYGSARTDARTDIYALGATLYAALSGSPPEDGLAIAINQTTLTGIREHNPRTNSQVAAAVERALEVNSEDRYQSAAEFKLALLEASDTVTRQVATGDVTVTPPPAKVTLPAAGPTRRKAQAPGRERRGTPWLAVLFGIIVVAGLVVVGVVFGPQWFGVAPPPVAGGGTTPEEIYPTGMPENFTQPGVVPSDSTPTGQTPAETLPPGPTPQGGAAELVFASDRSGELQLWLMDVETGETNQLTDIPGGACQPSWSPDGQRLVFITPCEENVSLYKNVSLFTVNVDGTGLGALPGASPLGDFDPDWSPVDNRILFTSLRDNNRPQVYMIDLDTNQVTSISNNSVNDSQPAWSPDASLIAFITTRLGRTEVWTMNVDGTGAAEFSKSGGHVNQNPAWPPDQQVILFAQFGAGGGGLPGLVAAPWRDGGPQRGTNEFRLSDDPPGQRDPDYSPDGTWILFSGLQNGGTYDIFMMRSNGTAVSRLTDYEGQDFDPVWRPIPPGQ